MTTGPGPDAGAWLDAGPSAPQSAPGADAPHDAWVAPADAAAQGADAAVQGPPTDAAPEPAEDAAAPAESPSTKPGTSFDDAVRIEVNANGILVDELSAEQVDFFVFHGEAGKFYELTTDRRPPFSPDNVLALYDAERTLIAQNDDGSLWTGDAIDTRLVFRIAKDGDYFIRVEDPYTPAEDFGGPFSFFYYEMSLREVGANTEGFNLATKGSVSEVRFVHDDASGYDHVTLLGLAEADADAFAFSGLVDRALIGHVHPAGEGGDGSSFGGGLVQVASDAPRVLAAIDRALGQQNIHPPVSDGRYTLEFRVQTGAPLGDNPYYAVDLVMLPENPSEQHDAENDQLSGAEPVMLKGSGRRRGLLLSRLPAGDVDYYRFDLLAGDLLRASCESQSAGSGVRGLTAELRDKSDTRLESSSESALENLVVPQIQVDEAGTYYLRLASDEGPEKSVEPWVRCAVLVNQ